MIDLIDVMLCDPIFTDSDETAVDEILTIFFAGSQTSANATQNLILHLIKHPHYMERVINEIREYSE